MSHGADANANQAATANAEAAKEAPPAFGPDDGITTRQGRAVEALLREGSITRAAAAVGVNERTLRRWGKEPAFRAAVLRGRREAFGQAIGLTQRYAPVAVATLVKVMNDPSSAASAKVRDALCAFLTNAGHDVRCVSNGKEALAAVLANTPELVVLDIFMPEMDGATFLEIIRSYLRLQSLPVIVLTGLPDSPAVDHARHLHVNTILVKGKATYEEIADAVKLELHRAPH